MPLKKIILARENRAAIRNKIADSGNISLSVSLNVPGFPKTSECYTNFFREIIHEIKCFLKARLVELKKELITADHAGDFFICSVTNANCSPEQLKQITESFEMNHPLGRFIDVDVFDKEGKPASSGKSKKCFYCGKYSAIECMRSKRHSLEEIRKFQEEKMMQYFSGKKKDNVCRELAALASRSILYEVALSPKPGLVDYYNSGVHNDMDYFTFLNSSAAISQYFNQLAQAGYVFTGDFSGALPLIRETGLQMEKDMFASTNNVNTQKGIIFLMGVALFTTANIISNTNSFDIEKFKEVSTNIGKTLLAELENNSAEKTHGRVCYEKYGKEIGGGARYEVASGFSTAINSGFNLLIDADLGKLGYEELQSLLMNVLLSIMANNSDTNILYRSDLQTLNDLKNKAAEALKSNETKEQKSQSLIDFCKEKKISPGGSADLLAVSLFLHFVNNKYNHGN